MGQLQRRRSFWSRPEAFIGSLMLGLAGGIAIKTAILLAPFILTTAAITAVGTGSVAAAGALSSRKFREKGNAAFQNAAYTLTRAAVPRYPIMVSKMEYADLSALLQEIKDRIVHFRGNRDVIKRQTKKVIEDEKALVAEATKALEQGDELSAASFGRRSILLETQRIKYVDQLRRYNKNLKDLMLILRVSESELAEMKLAIDLFESDWELAKQTEGATNMLAALRNRFFQSNNIFADVEATVQERGFLAEARLEMLGELTQELQDSADMRNEEGLARITALVESKKNLAVDGMNPEARAQLDAEEEMSADDYDGSDAELEAMLEEFDSVHSGRF